VHEVVRIDVVGGSRAVDQLQRVDVADRNFGREGRDDLFDESLEVPLIVAASDSFKARHDDHLDHIDGELYDPQTLLHTALEKATEGS
jgi:hypothetical protein